MDSQINDAVKYLPWVGDAKLAVIMHLTSLYLFSKSGVDWI